MRYFHLFITCLLIINSSNLSTTTDIKCHYSASSYFILGSVYLCRVDHSSHIKTRESAQITSVNGQHLSAKTDIDVVGIEATGMEIHYFPQNLQNLYPNLKLIHFVACPIEDIFQADLKFYPKLVFLYVAWCNVEVLEAGLFNFNTELEVLGITGSRIQHIDPNVFDNLNKLSSFWFENVPCIETSNIYGSIPKVKAAIKEIKTKCEDIEFWAFGVKIDSLKKQSEVLSFEDFKRKVEKFEIEFKSSNFSQFQPLKREFENLKHNKVIQ
ncbi:hypothetical protein ACKWTF_014470 [Chironomus riparius]